MNKLIVTAFFILFSLYTKAGWYEVYTYDGILAGKKVHFSLQFREINSTSKDSILLTGIYKYNHINEPLELRGFLINNDSLKLQEYHNEESFADITFKWNNGDLVGLWENTQKKYSVKLKNVGKLTDLDADNSNPPTEILMSTCFDNEYLVGIYEKLQSDDRAKMVALLVKSKKSNIVLQRINFDFEERPIGNVMTVIFENAITDKYKGGKMIEVTVDDGRMGESFLMKFNEQENKFILDN